MLALCFGFGWPVLERGMDAASRAVLASGAFGLFVYGVLNRVLIVTGLHHILNNLAWFLLGDYDGATGDLNRFFAGDPTAGAFMSGFFPVMMFGLPAACLAMYRAAPPDAQGRGGHAALDGADLVPDRRHRADRVHLHVPRAGALRDARGADRHRDGADGRSSVRLGFGFSAGLFDYVLNFSRRRGRCCCCRSGWPTSRSITACSASSSCAST